MNSDYPHYVFLQIARECREELIQDTLSNNSPDLYDALYSDINSEIFNVKMELYQLKWIERHWTKISEIIEKKNLSSTEKRILVSQFSEWYLKFISEWQYTEFDSLVFEERKNILKALISVNNEWDNNIKRMKVSFEQSKKKLNKKITELERGA